MSIFGRFDAVIALSVDAEKRVILQNFVFAFYGLIWLVERIEISFSSGKSATLNLANTPKSATLNLANTPKSATLNLANATLNLANW